MPILILKIFLFVLLYRAYCYEKRRGFLIYANKLYGKYIVDQTALKKPEIEKDTKLCEIYAKSYHQLLSEKTTIKKYILDTGIKEPLLPITQPVQGGGLINTTFSVLDYPYQIQTIGVCDLYYRSICEAVGYYKHRRDEGFNPLFWIEYMIFLPKRVAGYIGVSSKTFLNIAQGIYWLMMAIILFGVYIYNINLNKNIPLKSENNRYSNFYINNAIINNDGRVIINGKITDTLTGDTVAVATQGTLEIKKPEQ